MLQVSGWKFPMMCHMWVTGVRRRDTDSTALEQLAPGDCLQPYTVSLSFLSPEYYGSPRRVP